MLVGTVDFVQQVDHVGRLFSRLVEALGSGEVVVTAILLSMVRGFFPDFIKPCFPEPLNRAALQSQFFIDLANSLGYAVR